jgi:hypothetical protein
MPDEKTVSATINPVAPMTHARRRTRLPAPVRHLLVAAAGALCGVVVTYLLRKAGY